MPKPSNRKYTLEDLDNDLLLLNKFLEESNVTINDRFKLIKPLTSKIPKHIFLFKKYVSFNYCWLTIFIASTILLLFLKDWEYLNWHASAIGRIVMIKLLPYFDWRYLKNEVCLIPKFTENSSETVMVQLDTFDCDLCESLREFDYLPITASSEYLKKLIEADKPFVVAGQINHWIKEAPENFINQVMNKKEFYKSIPCHLATNFHNSKREEIDIDLVLRKKMYFESSFFIHFQNCDLDAMKVFRNYTYRPVILPDEISPVTYNWLIWNKNYNSAIFRKLFLFEAVAAIGQMFGSTRLRLLSRKNCKDVCPVLEGVLSAGQMLVFTSLWDVEYLAEGEGENMAAVLEIKG